LGKLDRLCVVIVNYRTAAMTAECVRSVAGQLDGRHDRIVVVDNASGETELARLSACLGAVAPEHMITVIPLASNGGFSAGNNAGIRTCRARFYLLANSDTVFLPGAVSGLLEAASWYPDAGLVTPSLEDTDGTVQVSCFRFPAPASELIHSAETGLVTRLLKRCDVPLPPLPEPSHPEWTSFACVLVRDAVIDAIGVLDDGFFMYFEDVDYCHRARAAGFDIVNWPASRVIHLHGRSSGIDAMTQARERLPDYYYHSRARYYRKRYGSPGLLAANTCWLLGRAVSLVRRLFGKRGQPVTEHEFFDIWKHQQSWQPESGKVV
jgi:GT2 family glycosyltransferase